MKPGIKDVAKVAGVSPTTVSRVLNNRGYISEETRKKVYDAMEEINYYPNEIARALLNNRTYFVGVIVPTVTSPFHGEVVEQIEYYLSQKNYKMLLCNSKNQMDTEKAYIDMLRRNQVDGMIVGTHNAVVETYSKLKMPVVGIDRYLGEHIPVVSCDNYAAGQMATRHLIDKGCQHILCFRVNSKLNMPGNNLRQAYILEMEKVGLPQMILEVPFIMENVEKQKLIYDMLNAHPEIDGIFAGDDSLAVIALHVARQKGINIPKDLKIIGVDGTKQILGFVPELTTIQQPVKQIAKVAVDKLIDLIEGKTAESCMDLPVKLLEGQTT